MAARESYRQAFMLALNHPGVVEDYLGLLSELNDFEEIMWVDDQFRRAARRGGPILMVKAGSARSLFQRRILEWAGIEVEHGQYWRSLELYNLSLGRQQTLKLPAGGGISLLPRMEFAINTDRIPGWSITRKSA